ncbi:MAG: hypothetical protein ACTSO7_08775 [Candidatus Heimdallarchaeota archaeon]
MQIKRKVIFALIFISFLSFSVSSANLYQVTDEEFVYFYSDYIIPGEVLEWNVVTFVKEADVYWSIKDGFLVEEGDVIKFEIKKDPDELTLTGPYALQYTDQYWADFYLNDELLGNDSSVHDYFINGFDEAGDGPDRHMGYLLPPDRESSSVKTNYFDDLVDEMAPDCFNNETGFLVVEIIDDIFQIHWEYHNEEPHPTEAGTIEIDRILEINYNIEWGYLSRMKIYESVITDEDQEILELVLENSKSTQATSIEWVTGLSALFALGTIATYLRRRK